MKKSLLLFCSLLFTFWLKAISVYSVVYTFPSDVNAIRYDAFLVRNDAGGGFIRVKYSMPEGGSALVDMSFTEELKEREHLIFKGANPIYIRGTGEYNPDYFWFKYEPETNVYKSWRVSSTDSDGNIFFGTIESFVLLDLKKLDRTFVGSFFNTNEPFYTNLFSEPVVPTFSGNNIKLHLILVSDTWDESIGFSCIQDENRAYSYFQSIAAEAGMEFVPQLIHGKDFNKAQVLTTIESLAPDTDDVVVFYYDGHGFRRSADIDPYPRLDIRLNNFDDPMTNCLSLSWVSNTIKSKNARLSLVIGDCCNSIIDRPRMFSYGSGTTDRSLNTLSSANCVQLFLRTRAHITATAATAGQSALGSSDGGLFTKAFFSSIDYELSTFNGSPSWSSMLSSARLKTIDYSRNANCSSPPCRHDPIYFIDGAETSEPATANNQTTTSNKKPQARIESVWEEFDVFENGQKGMRIHVKFYTYNLKGQQGSCTAYFYFADGRVLKNFNNNNYCTPNGQVCSSDRFTPSFENAVYEDFKLFIPYSELHLNPGHYDLKFYIEVQNGNGARLAFSNWYYFQVDQG